MTRYAVGDIHGGSKTFRTLLDTLSLKQSDRLYLMGDYVDRGNDSKGVLDTVIKLKKAGYDVQALRGNHDDMMLRAFTEDHDEYSWHWMKGWGTFTLQSFGVTDIRDVPSLYLTFLDTLQYVFEEPDFVLVHAGLDMEADDPVKQSKPSDMIWGDVGKVYPKKLGGRKLITGHTIRPIPLIEISMTTNRIYLDNGAFTNKRPDLGNLVALNLDAMELIIQPWLDGESVA